MVSYKQIPKGTKFGEYQLKSSLELVWEEDIDEKGKAVKGCSTIPELIEILYYNYNTDKKGTSKHLTKEKVMGWGESKKEALDELNYLIEFTLELDGTDPQLKGFSNATKQLFEKVK